MATLWLQIIGTYVGRLQKHLPLQLLLRFPIILIGRLLIHEGT